MQSFLFFFDEPVLELTQNAPLDALWLFLPFGYLLTILIETPVLLAGLSRKLSFKQKFWSGVWLTACTYPVVVLVLPALFLGSSRTLYLFVAETFAPIAECVFFWLAFRTGGGEIALETKDWLRSFAAITIANLASFGVGEIFNYYGWFGLF